MTAGMLALSACTVAAFPAAAAPAAQIVSVETFERTVALPSGGSFSLTNINGSIEIEGWNRDEVQILAKKITSGTPSDLNQVGIVIAPSAGRVSVSTRYPEGSGVEVNVEFHVRVPARVLLESVTTVNGSIAVHDVSGAGRIAAVNGNAVLARSGGPFSVHATNGNVSVELLALDTAAVAAADRSVTRRGISADTVNGTVTLALPEDAGFELEARTQNGDFSSDLPLLARTSTSAGRVIHGHAGDGAVPVYLRTVNGSIRLRISRPLV